MRARCVLLLCSSLIACGGDKDRSPAMSDAEGDPTPDTGTLTGSPDAKLAADSARIEADASVDAVARLDSTPGAPDVGGAETPPVLGKTSPRCAKPVPSPN